jgi:hypothetical protein
MTYFQTSTSPIKKATETNELLENELQRLARFIRGKERAVQ